MAASLGRRYAGFSFPDIPIAVRLGKVFAFNINQSI